MTDKNEAGQIETNSSVRRVNENVNVGKTSFEINVFVPNYKKYRVNIKINYLLYIPTTRQSMASGLITIISWKPPLLYPPQGREIIKPTKPRDQKIIFNESILG